MKISKTVEYGLLAVAYVAQHSKDGLVVISRVSKEYGISEMFLTKVGQEFVKANILRSKRGPRGGYSLARPANEISMLDIIETLEGSLESKMETHLFTSHSPFTEKMEIILKDATTKAKDILHEAKISKMIK